MPNGRGSVYRRKGGKLWSIDFTIGGRRVREGVSVNRRIAEMVLAKRMADAVEGRYFNKSNPGRMPFSEFAKKYLGQVVVLLKSARSESIRVRRWVRDLGNKPLGEITRVELESWQLEMRLKCKPSTVNREMCRLRHMLNKAVEWGLLEKSPMQGLKFLRENNARQRYLSVDECRRLIDGCIARHLKAVVIVAIRTGMRMGEILGLRYQDLDFLTGFILIPDSKNGEPRHVPMDSTLAPLLKSYPRRPGSDLVFSNPTGGRYKEVRQGFKMARERTGLSDLHFHDLRHTFASHWMMNGGDLFLLQRILGHKSIAMTQRYAHLSPAYTRAAVSRIDNMWRELGSPSARPNATIAEQPSVTDRSQGGVSVPAAPRQILH
jgi:integrase